MPALPCAIRGQSRGKRVAGTREIEQALKGERWPCRDGILKIYPCDKCGRGEEEAANYRPSTEQHVKQVLLDTRVANDTNEALTLARLILEMQRGVPGGVKFQ
jgi:hypothetical protein